MSCQLLPVMDLKDGAVVHAVAGRRQEYRPVHSQLTDSSTPAGIALAFRDVCGLHDVYVADLDAIAASQPNWEAYAAIRQAGLRLVLDAGIPTLECVQRFAEFADPSQGLDGLVIGSEVMSDPRVLPGSLELFGPDRVVFSLDLKHGNPIVANSTWHGVTPLEIVDEVIRCGLRRVIVLDLAAVGVGQGPVTAELCRDIRRAHPSIDLISGGGVRNEADVRRLSQSGCDRVLVATALHERAFPLPISGRDA